MAQRTPNLNGDMPRVVPPLVGWGTRWHTLANIGIFCLVALAGEWTVHQVEFRIEYGARFNAAMGVGPHHLYMHPLGLFFAASIAVLSVLAWIVLHLSSRLQGQLRRSLPERIACLRFVSGLPVTPMRVVRTASVLAVILSLVYLVQENLEIAAVGGGWPGITVLLGPGHGTALPLHGLVAFCLSLALWTFALVLRRSRSAVRLAQLLVACLIGKNVASQAPQGLFECIVHSYLVPGARSLRSPPIVL
ncbi:MAG: hypothetical protein NVSMB52_14260 [Chloroflexota bacterium]